MYRVRTASDRDLLLGLVKQATRLALSPCKQWRQHQVIAETLQAEIDDMLIFEDYRVMANGTLRKQRRQ